jgi:hypothetical protein
MGNEQDETSSAVHSIWARLLSNVRQSKDSDDDPLTASAVERQTENSRKGGTIWEAVRKADQAAMERLVKEDPKNVDARGPVGECPIHMLFLYGSETHLNMARYLITKFPRTITQIYNQSVNEINIFSLRIFIEKKNEFFSRNIMAKMFFILQLLNEMQLWLNGF